MPQLMQLVEPQQEQLELELEPLVAAVSPSRDASETSITSMSSMFLIASFICLSSLSFLFDFGLEQPIWCHCNEKKKIVAIIATIQRFIAIIQDKAVFLS